MSTVVISPSDWPNIGAIRTLSYSADYILPNYCNGSEECSFQVRTNSTRTPLHGDSRYRLQYIIYTDSHGITKLSISGP